MTKVAFDKRRNIKISLDTYVSNNLGGSEGLIVNYEGLPFDDTSYDSWIQPRVLNIYSDPDMRDDIDDLTVIYEVNIFAKKSGVTNSQAHYMMRDQVANYFRINEDILMNDSVTYMRVRGILEDSPLVESNEYYQYVVAWELRL